MRANKVWNPLCWLILCSFVASCVSRRGSTTHQRQFPGLLVKGRKSQQQMVMFSGADTFAVTDVQVWRSKRQFTVQLARPDSILVLALRGYPKLPGKRLYLYLRDSASYTLDEPHTIPMDRIARIGLSD